MQDIQGLIRYMESIQEKTGLTLVIKDFVGFLVKDPQVFEVFEPFYTHHSPYCMYVKDHAGLWDQCLRQKDTLKRHLEVHEEAYYGCCYAGVGEYVVPLIHKQDNHDHVVGAVCIGGLHHQKGLKRIEGLSGNGDYHKVEAGLLYDQAMIDNKWTLETIKDMAMVISDYLILYFSSTIAMSLRQTSRSEESHGYVIGHAVTYVKSHYRENMGLEDLSRFCHCSASYISHHFKALTGLSLKAYVNHLRIEAAVPLLEAGDLSITDIAYEVGYRDSNYFSTVFRRIKGLSPRAYQKSM